MGLAAIPDEMPATVPLLVIHAASMPGKKKGRARCPALRSSHESDQWFWAYTQYSSLPMMKLITDSSDRPAESWPTQ